jgi:hypothetical protein
MFSIALLAAAILGLLVITLLSSSRRNGPPGTTALPGPTGLSSFRSPFKQQLLLNFST